MFSFHGIPESYIGDDEPYQKECLHTAHLIAMELKFTETEYEIAFQSRFGKAEWIKPYLSSRLEELPNEGEISIGDTVSLNYVDQSRDILKPDQNVWQTICDGQDEIQIGKKTIQSRAYVGQFNFKGSDQQKIVSQLSGGERNRVHLAKMLKDPGNVLLLDEPTNDLDVDTLRALEEAILDFSGCVVVISHDRWFLDRVATHILAFEGNSQTYFFFDNAYCIIILYSDLYFPCLPFG